MTKPTLDEVLEYAEEQIRFYLFKYANDRPREQRDEMSQDARLRVVQAYEKLDPEKGWKAFVQRHCFGSVFDYLRRGHGCEEESWAIQEGEAPTLKSRLDYSDADTGKPLNVDQIVGIEQSQDGPIRHETEMHSIQWELLARLCRVDPDLRLFVRNVLLGHPLTELTSKFGVTRERLGQRLSAFIASLDAPEHVNNPWINQIIFALGLSEHFHMRKEDLGIGWTFLPVDLSPYEEAEAAAAIEQLNFDFYDEEIMA